MSCGGLNHSDFILIGLPAEMIGSTNEVEVTVFRAIVTPMTCENLPTVSLESQYISSSSTDSQQMINDGNLFNTIFVYIILHASAPH